MNKEKRTIIGLVAVTALGLSMLALYKIQYEIGLSKELMFELEKLNTELKFARIVDHIQDEGDGNDA